jgi:hypothetical protein
MPTTAASATSGCSSSAFSTSLGLMLNPPLMISSLRRSTTVTNPSASTVTMSPVRSHPPASSVLAVSSGRFQYPWKTWGPRTRSSPSAPSATSRVGSAGSTTRISVLGNGTPTVPGRRSGPIGLPTLIGDDSVMP